nr:immunoglobulin light chain junction region [Macaca mulatta]MOV34253.1 immunoglobulin light chain junction region [Macaca mulatta]MOV34739.1 immunoglobulin light chain junction region [Macaca mulatta]MOV35213.1 immunoglobulin light chain junction region [Macaca mulatta]MOV35478.1 immunoglobulin light chain junction region [Macaca mulatta]
CHQHNSYHSF